MINAAVQTAKLDQAQKERAARKQRAAASLPTGYNLVTTGLSQAGDFSYDGVTESWDLQQPLTTSDSIGVPASAFWGLARKSSNGGKTTL